MSTSTNLQARIAELETEQRRAAALLEISQGLSTASDEQAVLLALSQPAIEDGAVAITLMYFDLDSNGEPEWARMVAFWSPVEIPADQLAQVSMRIYLPDFPSSRMWLAQKNQPQIIPDVAAAEDLDDNTRMFYAQMNIRAAVTIPFFQAGRWVGALSLTWAEPHPFDEERVAIYRALPALASPAVAGRRLLSELEAMVAKRTDELAAFRSLVENATDAIGINDMSGRITYANPACYQLYGYDHDRQEMHGQEVAKILVASEDQVASFAEAMASQVTSGGFWNGEMPQQRKDGTLFDANITMFAVRDPDGQPTGASVIIRDITERKQAEAERERLQQEVIEAQQQALRELSTPIIPVMDGIIVMPLIGSIDTLRAKDTMRALMQGISAYRAKVVILDITGVPLVDSGVADHLNKTIQAARLKGTRTIVTGVSDAVAETIVDLGIDWGGIETVRDLQTGLVAALQARGMKLVAPVDR